MTYNNGFPVTYPYYQMAQQPMMLQQPTQTQQQQPVQLPTTPAPQNNDSGFVWVQGEEGAKAYLVAPGATVLLMDSENSVFYLKSANSNGVPQLRIFDYTERNHKNIELPVSKPNEEEKSKMDEFEKQINSLKFKMADLENQILDITTAPSRKEVS